MSEQKLDDHLPKDGNEYLFTDTFPKGTGKGLIVVAIAAVVSLVIYNILPFDISANKDGCFPYVFDGVTYWFDFSLSDPPAAAMTETGVIGLLGTEATVRQRYVDDLEREFAKGKTLLRYGP